MSTPEVQGPPPPSLAEARATLAACLTEATAAYKALLEAYGTGQGLDDARSSFDLHVRGLADSLRAWEAAEDL